MFLITALTEKQFLTQLVLSITFICRASDALSAALLFQQEKCFLAVFFFFIFLGFQRFGKKTTKGDQQIPSYRYDGYTIGWRTPPAFRRLAFNHQSKVTFW